MNKKGFTLIELLGVILIISLLVIIVLPKITNSVNNFSSKTDKLMMNMIEDAAKLYVEDNQDEFVKENGASYCLSIRDLVNQNYLKGPVEYRGEDITNTKGLKFTYNDSFEYELTDLYKGSCSLANYITNLYSETKITTVNGIEYSLDEENFLMSDRLGSNDVAKTDGNIRYYGANPNNYVDIGDRDKNGNIIFWRIIGLFKDIEVTDEEGNVIKTEDLVKIIRADFLTSGVVNEFSWDYTEAGSYDNNWHDSTLQVILNNAYYNSGITSYYNNSTTPTELNFTSTGLSSNTHSKIERVKWSLGGHNTNQIYTDVMYQYERKGTNKWSGKVTLMHPSDYGYSADLSSCQTTLNGYGDSTCKTTNWMYDSTKTQWTLTPSSLYARNVFHVFSSGDVLSDYYIGVNNIASVRPVLYLNSNVGIVEEKETSEGLKYFVVE